ncbi:mRNA-degrading endonuclease toxin of MazEF toxin-antitoxin module [Catenuloplanes nepalensis]|uniref:mRNA-degrading endonuclease toxin of MazEF toxin-antitoxin module n=2 Tax=Catenuloplanes nepalensis TaxID=587533 RepID=A0ABT9MXA7_9ACTN|nr:mRNA-degrading endonuclease toxin of MazEF toxin-antitoxin module [Catenuloplanes nepalensis]
MLRGSSQYRVLIISNDEYNDVDDLAVWALTIVRDVPGPNHLVVPLVDGDPLAGAWVRIHAVVQIADRTALRDRRGFVSHTTMEAVEAQVREFLSLP